MYIITVKPLSSQLTTHKISIYQFDVDNALCPIKLAKGSCSQDYFIINIVIKGTTILQFMSFAYCICHVPSQFVEAM